MFECASVQYGVSVARSMYDAPIHLALQDALLNYLRRMRKPVVYREGQGEHAASEVIYQVYSHVRPPL
jgi:hypothetical protein